MTYITWSGSRTSKVHYTEDIITEMDLQNMTKEIKLLCGKRISPPVDFLIVLHCPVMVFDWLNIPCKRCKAIYTIRYTSTMDGYHTILEQMS